MTSDSIKVVLYLAQPNDPILKYIEGSIADTDTNQQTIDTVKGYIKFLETYSETYGRHVDLVPFVGTGVLNDEVAARADATTIAESIKPFAVLNGPLLTAASARRSSPTRSSASIACPASPTASTPRTRPTRSGRP